MQSGKCSKLKNTKEAKINSKSDTQGNLRWKKNAIKYIIMANGKI